MPNTRGGVWRDLLVEVLNRGDGLHLGRCTYVQLSGRKRVVAGGVCRTGYEPRGQVASPAEGDLLVEVLDVGDGLHLGREWNM